MSAATIYRPSITDTPAPEHRLDASVSALCTFRRSFESIQSNHLSIPNKKTALFVYDLRNSARDRSVCSDSSNLPVVIHRYESNRLLRSIRGRISFIKRNIILVKRFVCTWRRAVSECADATGRVREQGRRCLQTSVTTYEHLSLRPAFLGRDTHVSTQIIQSPRRWHCPT